MRFNIKRIKGVFDTPLRVVLLMLVFVGGARGQYSSSNEISVGAALSTGAELPFWFTHNQSGKYSLGEKSIQMMELESHHSYDSLFGSPFGVKGGVDFIASHGGNFDFQFNELYAGVSLWGFKLEGGLFNDSEYFSGLSSTNGDIARSLNARPYPKVRFGTEEFIPFFFWKDWFSYKAEYDEGWLGQNQAVVDAHMHHKSLYAKFKFKKETYFTFGLNHFVQWGGVSKNYGQLPDSFKSYLRYITGSSGSSDFLETDQLNVAGNQYGSYYMELAFKRDKYNLTFYYSHPFEDHSGMEMDNWRDNLLGVYVDLKKPGIVEKVVYEFMYTKHQSGHIHQFQVMRGLDNYFNHGVYYSGATYEGFAMCSPLFSPLVIGEDGISYGFENNRLSMHHVAAEGTLYKNLSWSGMVTYTNNLGKYWAPYTPARNQVSAMFSFEYCNPKFPVDISLSLAGDFGAMYEDRGGVMLGIGRKW